MRNIHHVSVGNFHMTFESDIDNEDYRWILEESSDDAVYIYNGANILRFTRCVIRDWRKYNCRKFT
jgi:hypothetical protein